METAVQKFFGNEERLFKEADFVIFQVQTIFAKIPKKIYVILNANTIPG
jgi:hypothetical protein